MWAWSDLQAIAAMVSASCSIVAATVAVMVYRKARATDLSAQITQGDRALRKHTDKTIGEVKAQLVDTNERLANVEEGVARIEESRKHFLIGRDLGPIHEKINDVAKHVAANQATSNALREQLGVIHELLLRRER
ncbi:hypothetical protein KR767_04140 [Luteibacter anthropi]|uniref:hypothetical protein n=1 Tax=Luteibacter anthropi TaxID=564369 RepID=UPI002032B4F3|nr:hypothetical protein [Luteibacter anthropi]URX63267.1 hypothetical protein KR767_04140 [Luteibacter anthropi]